MTIICTTDELAGWGVQADEEIENAYIAYYSIDGFICPAFYPKNCWKAVYDLPVVS